MQIDFSPEEEAQLSQIANRTGRNAAQVVKETVGRMLEDQTRFVAAVRKGIEQADRGDLVEHDDVVERIERMFHS